MKRSTQKKWVFVTFADGNPEFVQAGKRIAGQAGKLKVFSDIRVYDGQTLANINSIYKDEFFQLSNQRGFGYWAWKPLLLSSLISEFMTKDGEISGIFYADSGCELPVNFLSRYNFRKLLKQATLQSVCVDSTRHLEIKYSKHSVLSRIDPENSFASSPQMSGTWVAIALDEVGANFVKKWVMYSRMENGLLINDILGDESELFIDHRHDQSILSLLYKQAGFTPFKIVYKRRFGSIRNSMHPIWLSRNRTGNSSLRKYVNLGITPVLGYALNVCFEVIGVLKRFVFGVSTK